MKKDIKYFILIAFAIVCFGGKSWASQIVTFCNEATCDLTITVYFNPDCDDPCDTSHETFVAPANSGCQTYTISCDCPIETWVITDGTNTYYSCDGPYYPFSPCTSNQWVSLCGGNYRIGPPSSAFLGVYNH